MVGWRGDVCKDKKNLYLRCLDKKKIHLYSWPVVNNMYVWYNIYGVLNDMMEGNLEICF